ncbi:signal transduction histidine kinase [Mycena galopus ATCC 62051]|nr:signal transduction histidine kinase [Mycena galopus ATCC 62051]
MAGDPPRPGPTPPSSDPVPVPTPKDAKADEEKKPSSDPPADSAEAIDMTIFDQILELDDEGTHEFSKEMVSAYFSQATSTFEEMDIALDAKNLPELGARGHFLKGSSAALGIHKVQAACEKMQHYGDLRDEEADKDLTSTEALDRIQALLAEIKVEYAAAEKWLKKWYKDQKDPFEEEKPKAP